MYEIKMSYTSSIFHGGTSKVFFSSSWQASEIFLNKGTTDFPSVPFSSQLAMSKRPYLVKVNLVGWGRGEGVLNYTAKQNFINIFSPLSLLQPTNSKSGIFGEKL